MLKRTLAVIALLALSTVAYADVYNSGAYVGIFGGAAFTPNITFDRGNKVDFDIGYDAGGFIGYKFPYLRTEAEFTYMNSDIDSGKTIPSINGDVDVYSGMANLIFDFDMLSHELVPYVGGGLGYANVRPHAAGINFSR